MVIKGIEISDFRGIHTGKINSFKKFNLLVGPNNSGKSSILEMLYLASTANQFATLEFNMGGRNDKLDCWTTKKDFLGNFSTIRVADRHHIVSEDFYSGVGTRQLSINSPTHLKNCSLHLTGNSDKDNGKYVGVFRVPVTESKQQLVDKKHIPAYTFIRQLVREKLNDSNREVEDDLLVYCWIAEFSYNNAGESFWTIKGKIPGNENTLFYDVSNMLNHFPSDFFQKMLKTVPGWTQEIANSFGRVINFNKPFNVQFLPTPKQAMQGWIAPADQAAIAIDSYGDGARNAFKVLAPLLALTHRATENNPGVFLWEEPELFQNPQTLGLLLKEIATLVKNKPIQIFMATHSMEVVAYFLQLVEDGLIGKDELTTIRMNLVDGKLLTSDFNYHEVEDWIDMKLDIRTPSGRFDKLENPLIYSLKQTEEDEE